MSTDPIVQILEEASSDISVREIRSLLRRREVRLSEYEITRELRRLIEEGRVQSYGRRWSLRETTEAVSLASQPKPSTPCVRLPDLSAVGSEALGVRSTPTPIGSNDGLATEPPGEHAVSREQYEREALPPIALKGPWARFRRLIAYYRHCIRNEEGAEASEYTDKVNARFIYLNRTGAWYPRPNQPWRYVLPIGGHLAPFIRNIAGMDEGGILILGYPVEAVYIERVGEPATAFLQPVFYYVIRVTEKPGALEFFGEDLRPEVNLKWLQYALNKPSIQRSFLSACGLISRPRPLDECPGIEANDGVSHLGNLGTNLSAFMPERIREPLIPDSVPNAPIRPPFQTGIYNRAVIMVGSRAQYSKTLLKELSMIERVPDKELDQTALRFVFREEAKDKGVREKAGEPHEGITVDTIPLNGEQRKAVASLLSNRSVNPIAQSSGPSRGTGGGVGKVQILW